MMSSQLRRRSDLVSDSILYRPHQGLKALLDRVGARMLRQTKSERRRNWLDIIAPTGVLRLAAGRMRPTIFARGDAMIKSSSARTIVNLGMASALAALLGACSGMSLPSFSS